MALSPFPGATEAELLAAWAALVQEELHGREITSTSSGDTSVAFRPTESLAARKRKIGYALYLLDAVEYASYLSVTTVRETFA